MSLPLPCEHVRGPIGLHGRDLWRGNDGATCWNSRSARLGHCRAIALHTRRCAAKPLPLARRIRRWGQQRAYPLRAVDLAAAGHPTRREAISSGRTTAAVRRTGNQRRRDPKGKLDWVRGWGLRDAASCAPVTADTAFQAASISKLVTATLALRLVEHGHIGLDQDINKALRSWQLPRDATLAPDGVSLRQLLSHTAGLGVHGFAGYLPDAPLPTPAQILDGTPPSNSAAVRSVLPAGAQFQYSGGGYVLTQLALSDVSRMPFAELAQRELFQPLGMTRSAYAQPPSADIRTDMAFGHANGAPIPAITTCIRNWRPQGCGQRRVTWRVC